MDMIKIWLLGLIINLPYRSILKKLLTVIWGHTLAAIAIVERWPKKGVIVERFDFSIISFTYKWNEESTETTLYFKVVFGCVWYMGMLSIQYWDSHTKQSMG